MNKKYKIIIGCLFVLIISSSFCFTLDASSLINQYEEEIGLNYIGTYDIIETCVIDKKVYITEEMKEIYDIDGTPYYTEPKSFKFLGITIKTKTLYYILVENEEDVITSSIPLKNDIQSLTYMISILEQMGYSYLLDNNSLRHTSDDNRDITNLVLGYIRSLNMDYYDRSFFVEYGWWAFAGNVDESFVNYVIQNDKSHFKIRDYFAYFIKENSYNSELHGEIDNELLKGGELVDPLNSNYNIYNKIDLIHMFATIDGTYDYTENCIIHLQNNFQRDISGWAGDLQTFTKQDVSNNENIVNKNNYYNNTGYSSNNPKNLTSFMEYADNELENTSSFDNEDMLADIDAINIVKLFLDGGDGAILFNHGQTNLLSSAINAYYNYVEFDNTSNHNRYDLFIESVAVDAFINSSSSYEKFKNKIYLSLALVEDDNGEIVDNEIFPYTSIGYYLLRDSVMFTGLPSYNDRLYVANLFIDYITDMSSSPVGNKYYTNISLHCESEDYIGFTNITNGETINYNINILCAEYYNFSCYGDCQIEMHLFDNENNLLNVTNNISNEGLNGSIITYLEVGSYQLKVRFIDEEEIGGISVELGPRSRNKYRELLPNVEVDALEHLHNGENYFQFLRGTANYYNLSLSIESLDENIIPYCSLEVYNTSTHETKIYEFDVDEINADNQYNYNILLEVNEYVLLKINFSSDCDYLNSCLLKIAPIETIKLDTLTSIQINNDVKIGDNICNWKVMQTSIYNLSISGSDAENVLFIIREKNGNNFDEVYSQELINGVFEFTYELSFNSNDDIYIGYVNGNGVGNLNISLTRKISDDFTILTDPNLNVTVGTEVTLNNGLCGSTTITEGFTRICYLGNNAPNLQSRTNYYWYSSDENIARVSAYGTVTAVASWEDSDLSKNVTIIAVYKDDPTIIASLQFTIYKTINTEYIYLNYGMDCRTGGTISGTEVTSGFGFAIEVSESPEVTMHVNKTRLICLGNDSPSSSIQDFIWVSNTPTIASVSAYGTITANRSGSVTITGTYKYNPNYIVEIYIEVLNF